jgi:hypothetical protein
MRDVNTKPGPLDQYEGWNADARATASGYLERGEALAAQAAQLSDNAWLLLFSWRERRKRRRVLEAAAKLRTDVGAIDHQIIDYWRLTPSLGEQRTGADWFGIHMSTRAIIRDTVLRYANDAIQTVHDNQLRAIARATLFISAVILVVSLIAAWPVVAGLIPEPKSQNAPDGQPPIDERGM